MLRLIRRYATTRLPRKPFVGSKTTATQQDIVAEARAEARAEAASREASKEKQAPESEGPRVHRRSILGLAWYWTKFALFLHIFLTYGYSLVSPYGASMLPTLYLSGEWVVVSHLHRRGKKVEVGDIVSVKHPLFPRDGGVMKRIVGMPGDLVLAGTPGQSDTMVRVPDGHCWLSGDNLLWSRDSRIFGAVPLALIRGKVVARIFPWRDRCWFRNPMEPLDDYARQAA